MCARRRQQAAPIFVESAGCTGLEADISTLALATVLTAVLEFVPPVTPAGARVFAGPFGIACGADGVVLVADDLAHRVLAFDSSGRLVRSFGSRGDGPGQLLWPDAVRTDIDGFLYIADTGANRIQVWQGSGQYLREFGRFATPGAQRWRRWLPVASGALLIAAGLGWRQARARSFAPALGLAGAIGVASWLGVVLLSPRVLLNPRDLLLGADGTIWVADFGSNRVRVFTEEGRLRASYGAAGSGAREINDPVGLASDGIVVYVSDSRNHRVVAFDRQGRIVRTFGARGSEPGELDTPYGLALGPDGHLYVADRGNRRVQSFSPEGTFVRVIAGDPASAIGTFTPAGICFTPDGRLLIVDTAAHRVLAVRE